VHDSYCYLPLYMFSGEHLLCARLRTADQDAAAGSKAEVERIVGQIRAAWPEVEIILRADSGFCREELMQWCEEHGVKYGLGFARNDRLRRMIEAQMAEAARLHAETGKPARVFSEFAYQTTTGSWSQGRANRCTRIRTAHAGRWRTASRSSCRDSQDDGLQLSAAMPVRAGMGGVALLSQPPGRHLTRNPLKKGKCGRKRFGIPAGRSAGALPP